MNDKNELLNKLPKIDRLLESKPARAHLTILGHDAVRHICRQAVQSAKERAVKEHIAPDLVAIINDIAARCAAAKKAVLGRVINGSGVLLHTNLGRAPLGAEIFDKMKETASGYCNLEIDVAERKRGVRGLHVSRLLAQACEAEDAIVVNNNAASLFLILREFAADREVVVSRGELVQIGGGFRIPDILASSGATLREVGTTNITTTEDYLDALNENTGLVLKVHKANFRMEGFVKAPGIKELARENLGGAFLVSDLGSGNLVRNLGERPVAEPTPAALLKAGADLVCFSCDKMLGGVQGGVIAGRSSLISRLRKNPVMRVVRVGKTVYAALQVVLTHHLAGEHENVKLWSMAAASEARIEKRVGLFIDRHQLDRKHFQCVASAATFGGGSTPGQAIPSAALRVEAEQTPDEVARFFQACDPPVVGTVKHDSFQIDFRTILTEDEPLLADACQALIKWINESG